jgi:hypothetical protein
MPGWWFFIVMWNCAGNSVSLWSNAALFLSYSFTQNCSLLTAFLPYTLALSDSLIAHLLNA